MGTQYHVQFPNMDLEFTVSRTAFQIGNFSVQWYGIIIGVGFLLALIYAYRSISKMNIDGDKLIDAVIAGLIGGVVGARLYYVLFFEGDKFWQDPLEIFKIHNGGMGFYGGLIGALLCAGLVARWRKMNIASLFDLASLGFLIGQAVGRWGNFVNQEAFGTETTLPWGMYSENTVNIGATGIVHPCFLYESLLCLVGFIGLHIFTRKYRKYDGQTFLLYVAWYGFIRFFIESLRTDSLIIPGTTLKVSMVLSAIITLSAFVVLVLFRNKTSLSGCGSKRIMELNGVVLGSVEMEKANAKEEDDGTSTIFGDLDLKEKEDSMAEAGEETTEKDNANVETKTETEEKPKPEDN